MAHRHLFRHPVGFFPVPARWYLAGAGMLALLLVAAHFAIQARTQDIAQATVEQWLQRSDGSVEQVRFHLLRNALTLQGVRLKSGHMSLFIPEMLLYGRVDSLLGGHPSLSRVTMTAPQLTLPVASAMRLLASQPGAGGTMFHQIWLMARYLEIHGGTLVLSTGGGKRRRWSLNDMNLLIREGIDGRTIQGGFRYRGASLTVHSRMHRAKDGADGEMSLGWDRVDGRAAAREILGLSPLSGEISGQLQWYWQAVEGSGLTRSHVQGDMRVVSGARVMDDSVVVPSLRWHADQAADGWHAEVTAEAWPLAPIRKLTPVWYGRRLVQGYFSGDVEADWPTSDPQPSRLRVVKGSLRDFVYAPDTWSGDAEERPDWRIDRIDVANASLDVRAHALSLGRLGMAGGEIRLLPGHALSKTATMPWRLDAKTVDIDRLALALVFADGRPVLRTLPLSGRASLIGDAFRCDLAASDAPVSWRIVGEGHLAWPDEPGLHLDVEAAGLPLTQLRALLPFAEGTQTGAAVQLDGRAGLSLAVDVDGSRWVTSGTVSGRNVAVSWQGDSWRAAHVVLDLDKVGNGLPVQSLRRLQVDGWQYQGALQSLTPAAVAGTAPDSSLPWRSGTDWRVDQMQWQGGTISFGRADAVWGSNVDLQLSGWAVGQMATLKLSGDVDGGVLQATGTVGRVDGVLRTDIKGSVLHARPFFLNEWLQVSGAPRVIRGRWSSRFTWQTDEQGAGHGHLRLWLRRWQLETGVFPNDPFLGRTGFGAHDLLQRLGADRLAVLDIDEERSATQPFVWSDAGDAMLAVLKRKANAAADTNPPTSGVPMAETRIRLHGKAELSHNERVRLRKLWRRMRINRHLVVDMLPQVQRQDLDEGLVATIRHTEDMIGRFMADRGISRSRIFPVWPTQANRGRGALGIRVEVRRP